MYDLAIENKLQFYSEISDCVFQCAATFGGGPEPYQKLSIYELLKYTDIAIQKTKAEHER